MKQLNALDAITLEAFQAALETCQARGVELPEVIQAVASDPTSHLSELDELSETDQTFEAFYQAERLVIQSQSSTRKKRLAVDYSETVESPLRARDASPLYLVQDIEQSHSKVEIAEPAQYQKAIPSSEGSNSNADTPPAQDAISNSADKQSQPTAPPTEEPGEEPLKPIIYRYTLPLNSTSKSISAFSRQVEAIRQQNPDWVVSFDIPNANEADAIFLIHKDENYHRVHATYLASRTLDRVVAPALRRVFN